MLRLETEWDKLQEQIEELRKQQAEIDAQQEVLHNRLMEFQA